MVTSLRNLFLGKKKWLLTIEPVNNCIEFALTTAQKFDKWIGNPSVLKGILPATAISNVNFIVPPKNRFYCNKMTTFTCHVSGMKCVTLGSRSVRSSRCRWWPMCVSWNLTLLIPTKYFSLSSLFCKMLYK